MSKVVDRTKRVNKSGAGFCLYQGCTAIQTLISRIIPILYKMLKLRHITSFTDKYVDAFVKRNNFTMPVKSVE